MMDKESWGCTDCLRQRGLLDVIKSEKNEEEGNFCANCFFSEDDMEGVTLKQCSNCKSVKYCRSVSNHYLKLSIEVVSVEYSSSFSHPSSWN